LESFMNEKHTHKGISLVTEMILLRLLFTQIEKEL